MIIINVLRKRVLFFKIESYIVIPQLLFNIIAVEICRKTSNKFVIPYLFSLLLTSNYFPSTNI